MTKFKRFVLGSGLLFLLGVLPQWGYAQAPGAGCGPEYEKLKKEHEALLIDYQNVLAQAKTLLEYKNKARDMEDFTRQGAVEKESLIKEKEEALAQAAELKDKVHQLDESIVKLTQERDEYKNSFEKASVGNIIGEETKKKIAGLEKQGASLSQENKDLENKIKAMEKVALKREAEAELSEKQISEARAKYDEARKQNRVLERKIDEEPKQFAELARENKVLIKRTATMHYNLGVFYTENKEFERAVAEFEKAVELNPEDSASYFNLGYIYAEQLTNRPKAVGYFKQYLKLAKRDDKDVDWVKRYILTWQTWEGKVPIK